MFSSNGVRLCSIARSSARSTTRPLVLRHYSTPLPADHKSPSPSHPVLSTAPSRKPKIDLRPAPVKPKSLKDLPNSPVKAKPVPKEPQTISLTAAKEEAQKVIADAEKHGILTPPPPGASWFKATLHKAIQLAKFYFRGVKLIFIRRKEIAAIRERIRTGGPPLTRAEFRLIARQKDDVNKVIPFIIVALLLEEVIPLIAIYAPGTLPSTCILPSQRESIETKKAEKAAASAAASTAIFRSLREHASTSSSAIPIDALRAISGAPTTICSVLGLSTLGVDALRIRRIRKHLEFISQDDMHLNEGQVKLSDTEVKEALAERGLLLSLKASLNEKQNLLSWWLNAAKSSSPEDAVAARLFLIISKQ
ncbi:hypothetical protein BKA70DRAFT_1558131 [Coprinopsis sp. MPI-PUGE-AT-0042]|nr:hypothetical protein BKA70DRAFT_1558131 [Coprinopsis sp. MPI-PUGE-AT-0042]